MTVMEQADVMTWFPRKEDGDLGLEEKIYRTMDMNLDLKELTALHKECEDDPEAAGNAEEMKKAKVGLIALKAYLSQVDCTEFAGAIRNEYLFKVGAAEGFGPWLDEAEGRIASANEV